MYITIGNEIAISSFNNGYDIAKREYCGYILELEAELDKLRKEYKTLSELTEPNSSNQISNCVLPKTNKT